MDDFMQLLEGAISSYDTLDSYHPLDVNLDNRVDMLDAVDIVSALRGNPLRFFVKEVADVDGDGELTMEDAVGLVMKICTGQTEQW